MMVSLFAFLRNGRETEGVFAVCFRFAPRGTSAAAHCRVVEAPSSLPAACGLPGQAGTSTSFSGRGRSGPSSGSAEGKPRVLRSAPPVPFPVRCPSAGLPEKKLLRVRSLGRAHAAAALLFGTCAPHSVRWAGMSPGSTHPPLGSRAAAQESSVPNTVQLLLNIAGFISGKLKAVFARVGSAIPPPSPRRSDPVPWDREGRWDGMVQVVLPQSMEPCRGSTRSCSISAPGEALPQSSPNGRCRGSSGRGSEAIPFHQTALPQHFQKDAQWKSDKS